MSRATHLAFLSMAVFLVLFTGTVGKPGLPPTLKADEPAYLLMAQSLVEDGDLLVEPQDLPRLLDNYPYLPTQNLILMSDDGWKTVYFGKPYIYPLLAAPLVAVFGANGLVSFNALLFLLMVWCGTHYLKLFNDEARAFMFAAAFFLLSPAWAYVFWIQPEILNMTAVSVAFFCVFSEFGKSRFSRFAVPLSAIALAIGIYNKPVLLAFALPLVYAIQRRRNVKTAGAWLATLAISMLALAGGSMLLTGHPTAYLGVARGGIKVVSPEAAVEVIEHLPQRLAQASTTANSWSWVFRAPPTNWREIRQSLGYFFWGRHTGLLLYMPFAVISFLLFLIHRRRRPEGWLTVLALATIALFFICVIPLNWHGGGGFIGNRYFVMAYPAFLFLVTTIKPAWLMVPGAASAGLFLGSILFTPFGAPVPLPTLQAHTRNPPFQWFPYDLSLRKSLPGYGVFGYSHLVLTGRKDFFMPDREPGGVPLIQARVQLDIMVFTDRLIKGLFFEITTFPPDNEIEIEFAGDREVIRFENAVREDHRSRVFEVQPKLPPREHWELGQRYYVYEMKIHVSQGERLHDPSLPSPIFFAGAKLNYIGRRDQITRPEHYRVQWLEAQAPAEVERGSSMSLPIRLRNTSKTSFSSEGPIPVNLTYRWVRPDGSRLKATRSKFKEPLAPGAELATTLEIDVPQASGDYQLVLDLVREHVGWFSDVASEAKSLTIRVR